MQFYVCSSISIDNHNLTMISSDGYRFKEFVVQSFIISPGERFDFIVEGTEPAGCYWIRAETLEQGVHHTTEAILQYSSNPLENQDYDDYSTNVSSTLNLTGFNSKRFPR